MNYISIRAIYVYAYVRHNQMVKINDFGCEHQAIPFW